MSDVAPDTIALQGLCSDLEEMYNDGSLTKKKLKAFVEDFMIHSKTEKVEEVRENVKIWISQCQFEDDEDEEPTQNSGRKRDQAMFCKDEDFKIASESNFNNMFKIGQVLALGAIGLGTLVIAKKPMRIAANITIVGAAISVLYNGSNEAAKIVKVVTKNGDSKK